MKKTKKVIGYVCDVPITGTDMVISKEDQRMRLLKYAKKEDLDLVYIFEDGEFTEDFMNRPGVQKAINFEGPYDQLLVERVWCLSRRRKELDRLLEMLDRRKAELVASSCLWDCVSQQVRHRYMGKMGERHKIELHNREEQERKLDAA